MPYKPPPHPASRFLRDPRLPWLEIRRVRAGNAFNHGMHSHDCHSFGAIVSGHSEYRNGRHCTDVSRGDTVIINAEDRHACNSVSTSPWSYDMIYLDSHWLAQRCPAAAGDTGLDVPMFSATTSRNPRLHQALMALADALDSSAVTRLERESHAEALAGILRETLHPHQPADVPPERLARVMEFMAAERQRDIGLEELCRIADCGATSLIAAFRRHYGVTPHAALVDLRIRQARQRLRHGEAIAEVALDCGFSDQAHLQRTFKRLLATTPAHYQGRRLRP